MTNDLECINMKMHDVFEATPLPFMEGAVELNQIPVLKLL
jgi:hypothetical protein